jgi:hypothetical protein
MTSFVLAAITAIFVLAGFVKGVIGLGLPTVAMGLLALVMTPAQAAALLVVPSFLTNVWHAMGPGRASAVADAARHLRRGLGRRRPAHRRWRRTRLDRPRGRARALRCARPDIGRVLRAGAARALAVAVDRSDHRHRDRRDRRLHDPVGALSTGDRAQDRRPGAGLSFTVATVALATSLVQDGALQISVAGASVAALAPALLGMVLGQWVRARARSETFRISFFAGSLLLGAHLALRGLI